MSSSLSVVVGAGLPGIAASLALANAGRDVLLIDSAPAIGGLLRSYTHEGTVFDYGTHFASYTGIRELDHLLFGGHETAWRDFPVLKAGNVCNGVVNSGSDNPDLGSFGRPIHDRCVAEMLAASGWPAGANPANAREYLLAEYGPTLLEVFFDPVFKKFTGRSAEELHGDANQLFHLRRFGVLTPAATAELKKSAVYDAKVSYHHRDHYSAHRPSRYPLHGGIGSWIGQLENKLTTAGVSIRTNAIVQRILHSGQIVTGVVCDGVEINASRVLWAGPPAIFCKLAGLEADVEKPLIRATVLVGLEFSSQFLSECQYLTVYDPLFMAFRITLYDNFRLARQGRHPATVEFMIDPKDIDASNWTAIAEREIRSLGLVEECARVLSSHQRVVPEGFPVQTNYMVNRLRRQSTVARAFKNTALIGRASGKGWFLNDLIRSAYEAAMHSDA